MKESKVPSAIRTHSGVQRASASKSTTQTTWQWTPPCSVGSLFVEWHCYQIYLSLRLHEGKVKISGSYDINSVYKFTCRHTVLCHLR